MAKLARHSVQSAHQLPVGENAGAQALGPDTPAGARLADSGRFLKYLSEDLLRHVEYWHTAITGRGPDAPADPPPDQP